MVTAQISKHPYDIVSGFMATCSLYSAIIAPFFQLAWCHGSRVGEKQRADYLRIIGNGPPHRGDGRTTELRPLRALIQRASSTKRPPRHKVTPLGNRQTRRIRKTAPVRGYSSRGNPT